MGCSNLVFVFNLIEAEDTSNRPCLGGGAACEVDILRYPLLARTLAHSLAYFAAFGYTAVDKPG